MNALVKKEIRLLLPAWIVALLLALPPICTRSDDGIPVFLLFFGLTIMALTSFGREASLNTFSQMLSQPAERMRIWQIKLSVLAVAFLAVFGAWRLATILSWHDYSGSPADPDEARAVLVAGSLIFVATFTGGLWTTLLVRQLAAAFWLTLLVPATLCGFTAAFFAGRDLDYYVIAMLCVMIGIYSVGGFIFARWLYFRAQDVGWSGLIIALPEWRFTRSETAEEIRRRRPIFALVKKEFQLQQGVFTGVAGLFVLHCGIIALRTFHHFEKDSAGEILTSIFWMLWLVVPVILGSMAVAEERKLGVMEGQLCLPVSRRVQFVIKGFLALLLGIFLGGVMPFVLETIGLALGGHNQIFEEENRKGYALFLFGFAGLAAWLSLVSFFASTLAKNFLQAVGFALVTFTGCMMIFPVFAKGRMIFFDSIPIGSILPLVIAVPTLVTTLLLLAYLNFKNFRDGWPLWRRNLLAFGGAMIFVIVSSGAIYNRAWEIFEPAEPAHGAAKLSLANPPVLSRVSDLQVRLPDGRVWANSLHTFESGKWWQEFFSPLPKSVKVGFIAGSNWTSVISYRDLGPGGGGFNAIIGMKTGGTLWSSAGLTSISATGDREKIVQFGNETNWQKIGRAPKGILFLKNDGTLWTLGGSDGLPWFQLVIKPVQIRPDAKWVELFSAWPGYVRKADGTVWFADYYYNRKKRPETNQEPDLLQETNLDQVDFRTLSVLNSGLGYVRADGTLWVGESVESFGYGGEESSTAHLYQVGNDTNWQAVAVSYHMMVALKNDGSLWQWNSSGGLYQSVKEIAKAPPTRLGIHSDWVVVGNTWGGIVTLAADGSLWFWPDRIFYDYGLFMKLPKQPRFLGNVFSKGE